LLTGAAGTAACGVAVNGAADAAAGTLVTSSADTQLVSAKTIFVFIANPPRFFSPQSAPAMLQQCI
jgi:hypothetical protein